MFIVHTYYSTYCQFSCNSSETDELQPIRNENVSDWLKLTGLRWVASAELTVSSVV